MKIVILAFKLGSKAPHAHSRDTPRTHTHTEAHLRKLVAAFGHSSTKTSMTMSPLLVSRITDMLAVLRARLPCSVTVDRHSYRLDVRVYRHQVVQSRTWACLTILKTACIVALSTRECCGFPKLSWIASGDTARSAALLSSPQGLDAVIHVTQVLLYYLLMHCRTCG